MNERFVLRLVFSFLIAAVVSIGFVFLMRQEPSIAMANASVLFVAPGGTGTACTQAQPCALTTALAQAHDGDTLVFARGTYTGTGEAVAVVNKSIALEGGWDGSPTGPVVRDPSAYPTVLDGERERRCVFLSGSFVHPITVTVEGFVIARGNATHASSPGYGGGIFSFCATPIIVGNVVTGNVASTTTDNGIGGGVSIDISPGAAVIDSNRIISNVASVYGRGVGGGVHLINAPDARVTRNVIVGNTAAISSSRGYGGGLSVEVGSSGCVLASNTVRDNVALERGGGRGIGYGGGVDIDSPSVLVTSNSILSNTAAATGGLGFGGGIAVMGASSSDVRVTDNVIEHNVAQAGLSKTAGSYGGGIYGYLSRGLIVERNTICHNVASAVDRGGGGGIGLWWRCDGATIAGNTIAENYGSTGRGYGYGGGVYVYSSSDVRVEANRIVSNSASLLFRGYGGGLYIWRDSSVTMTNNVVARNDASYRGGGIAFEAWGTQPVTGTLIHNSFVANDVGKGDGRIAIDLNVPHATLVLTNNIVYSHTLGVYAVAGSSAFLYDTLFFSNGSDTGGPGSIANHDPITGLDPLVGGDFHLLPGSPAIDAGADAGVTTDIDGDSRPSGPAPDIGADEYTGEIHRVWLPVAVR